MANVFKAGEGSGGWIQTAPTSWEWDSTITYKQTEQHFYRRWPKGYEQEKTVTEEKLDPLSEEILDGLNKLEDKKAKKAAKQKKEVSATKDLQPKAFVSTEVEFVSMPDKCPRQMRVILTKISEFGKGGVSISMLCDKLEGVLATKQPIHKVYRHYHREMVDKGYIRILS